MQTDLVHISVESKHTHTQLMRRPPSATSVSWWLLHTAAPSCGTLAEKLHPSAAAPRPDGTVGKQVTLQGRADCSRSRVHAQLPADASPGQRRRVLTSHRSCLSPNRGRGPRGDRDAATAGARGRSVTPASFFPKTAGAAQSSTLQNGGS